MITSSRFWLGPRQRAVLRFKWQCFAQGQPPGTPRIIDVGITRAAPDGPSSAATAGQLPPQAAPEWQRPHSPNLRFPAAHHLSQRQQEQQASGSGRQAALVSFKVAVLSQPAVLDRTLRLYHAAGPGQSSASHTVLFGRLPAAERLVCGNLRLACDSGLAATVVRGADMLTCGGITSMPWLLPGRLAYRASHLSSCHCASVPSLQTRREANPMELV